MNTKIKAEIVGHSLSPQGDELISVLATFPRIILAEVNTHRMLSKNTSRSRAIPFTKMVESIQNDPFIPIAWQKDHKGMQGNEYITENDQTYNVGDGIDFNDLYQINKEWLKSRDEAVYQAKKLNEIGVTKQLCNRLLEPFMWTTMLITGSREGWDNFFKLRNPSYSWNDSEVTYKSKKDFLNSEESKMCSSKDDFRNWSDLDWLKINKGQAEIHMMALAEAIYDSVNESTPKQLKAGEWHIPFEDKIDLDRTLHTIIPNKLKGENRFDYYNALKIKISTTMAAHTSYTTVGNEPVKSYEKWIELHDKLIAYDPPHSSPMEHCARVMSEEEYKEFFKGNIIHVGCEQERYEDGSYSEDVLIPINGQGWCYNLKGFIPYRYIIDNKINL